MSVELHTEEKLKLIEFVEFFYKYYRTLNFKPIWIEFEKLKIELMTKGEAKK